MNQSPGSEPTTSRQTVACASVNSGGGDEGTEQEFMSLWMTASPVNVSSPVCMVLAQLVAGAEHPEPIQAALGAALTMKRSRQ